MNFIKVKLLKSMLRIIEGNMRDLMELSELPRYGKLHEDIFLAIQESEGTSMPYKYWELPFCECTADGYDEECLVHGGLK